MRTPHPRFDTPLASPSPAPKHLQLAAGRYRGYVVAVVAGSINFVPLSLGVLVFFTFGLPECRTLLYFARSSLFR